MAMGMSGGGGRRRGRGGRSPMADINVTPLVDVMLVLLIIFMVTAPLLKAGVPVDLPESRAKALDYGRVMAVMGELNRAGFTAISLVTHATGAGPAVNSGSGEAP